MTSLFSRNSPKRKGAGAFSSRTEDPERTGWAKVYQKCRRPDTRHFFNTCNPVGSGIPFYGAQATGPGEEPELAHGCAPTGCAYELFSPFPAARPLAIITW